MNANGTGAHRLTSGTWSVAVSYPPGPPASPLSWSPDGKHLTFARVPDTHDGDAYLTEIAVLDVASGAVRALTGRHKLESFAAVSPDGRRVAYLASRGDDPNNENDLFVTGLAGGRGQRHLGQARPQHLPRDLGRRPHPAGRRARGLDQAMWLLRDDGSAQRVQTGPAQPNQGDWLQPAVGPDGALA